MSCLLTKNGIKTVFNQAYGNLDISCQNRYDFLKKLIIDNDYIILQNTDYYLIDSFSEHENDNIIKCLKLIGDKDNLEIDKTNIYEITLENDNIIYFYKKDSRILSLSMRPKCLNDFIGHDLIIKDLKNQFLSGRFPHFIIISGDIGQGKTTLSRIIGAIVNHSFNINVEYTSLSGHYDITEINASDKNGIDDIRAFIETCRYKPLFGTKAKVVIFDEAHRLTNPAQNALLKLAEDTPEYLYLIFCTSNIADLLPSVKRRAYQINLKSFDELSLVRFLDSINTKLHSIIDEEHLKNIQYTLYENNVLSPGHILQVLEKFLSSYNHTMTLPEVEYNIQTIVSDIFSTAQLSFASLDICKNLAKGNWDSLKHLIKNIKKEDIVPLKLCINGYLKTILLNSNLITSMEIAKAMRLISETNELSLFLANICLACCILDTIEKKNKKQFDSESESQRTTKSSKKNTELTQQTTSIESKPTKTTKTINSKTVTTKKIIEPTKEENP